LRAEVIYTQMQQILHTCHFREVLCSSVGNYW